MYYELAFKRLVRGWEGSGRPDGVAGYLNTVTVFSDGIFKKNVPGTRLISCYWRFINHNCQTAEHTYICYFLRL